MGRGGLKTPSVLEAASILKRISNVFMRQLNQLRHFFPLLVSKQQCMTMSTNKTWKATCREWLGS